jgi:hypothetical protein
MIFSILETTGCTTWIGDKQNISERPKIYKEIKD